MYRNSRTRRTRSRRPLRVLPYPRNSQARPLGHQRLSRPQSNPLNLLPQYHRVPLLNRASYQALRVHRNRALKCNITTLRHRYLHYHRRSRAIDSLFLRLTALSGVHRTGLPSTYLIKAMHLEGHILHKRRYHLSNLYSNIPLLLRAPVTIKARMEHAISLHLVNLLNSRGHRYFLARHITNRPPRFRNYSPIHLIRGHLEPFQPASNHPRSQNPQQKIY